MSLSVHSPDELIAAIPHMLGFKPQESIVLIPIRSDLPTARIDLPITPRAEELAWSSIRKGMVRYARPGAAVGIVCFTHDRQQADLIGREFAERLDTMASTPTSSSGPTRPAGPTSPPATWASSPTLPGSAWPP